MIDYLFALSGVFLAGIMIGSKIREWVCMKTLSRRRLVKRVLIPGSETFEWRWAGSEHEGEVALSVFDCGQKEKKNG